MRASLFFQTPRRRTAPARGFTLVELLVSLTGGLFVSLAVFALARDASRFYQREGRLANATLAGIAGFERLRADISRAGFLSTPNIMADPTVCARPGSSDPLMIQHITSVLLTPGASATLPDTLRLTGSYSSADEFPVRAITNAGGSVQIVLQPASGPMARLGYQPAGEADANEKLLGQVFASGRMIRILDDEGRQHYGAITDVEVTNSAQPIINVSGGSTIQFRPTEGVLCGLKGLATGATVNVVNVIEYSIRSLEKDDEGKAIAAYAPLYGSGGGSYRWDAGRRELVRRELDAEGTPLGSPELIAEYAIDLQFELTAVTGFDANGPQIKFVGDSDSALANLIKEPGTSGAVPQNVRAVRAHLAVRSREPDREAQAQGPDGKAYRVGLGGGTNGPFARVRHMQSDVMLNNHARLQW